MEEELLEEDFMERCLLELLEEEEAREWFIPSRDLPALLVLDLDPGTAHVVGSPGQPDGCVVQPNSSLNPNAKEFIPGLRKHAM